MVVNRIIRGISQRASSDAGFKQRIVMAARLVGYDLTHLVRKVYLDDCHRRIAAWGPANLDALEISGGAAWRDIDFRSYRSLDYPEFDICSENLDPALDGGFDIAIADQVFEHLLHPRRAARNVFRLLKPGGRFLITTPFLIRVHEVPYDCSRWTETGMRCFLSECGFPPDGIETASWGNLSAVKSSLVSWARVGWKRSFPNDPRFPVSIWAIATKPSNSQ